MNERVMINYLLGSLTEAETERLDELTLVDNDFAARLDAVENDLVDAYVRGDLPQTDLTNFQSHYLSSQGRREKVSFSNAFVEKIDKASVKKERPIDFRPARIFTSFRFAFPWGAAAVVVLLASFLLFDNIRLRVQLSGQRFSNVEKEKEIKGLRARVTELQAATRGPTIAKVFALNLEPSVRGVGKLPQLILPLDAETVALTLALEPNDYVAYQAALKEPVTGKELWRSEQLAGDGSVGFNIPAALLQTQNYSIELSGITAGRASEFLASYSFNVVRR